MLIGRWIQALTAAVFFVGAGLTAVGQPAPEEPPRPDQPDQPEQPEKPERPAQLSESSEKTVELIPLQSVKFEEIKPVLEPLLSESGELRFISSRHALMIYDTPDHVKEIEARLNKIDAPAVNIRIAVSFDDTRRKSGANVEADTGHLVIKDGEAEISGNVGIRGRAGQRRTESQSRQFVMTRNNRPARIWVGKSVPRQQWVYNYGVHHGWWEQNIVYQDIGASLWIHPRMVGENMVQVYVYPKLTLEGDQELSVEAKELATQVVVRDGGTVRVGGLDQEKREVYKRLFGIGKVFNGRSLGITLHAETVRERKPAPQREE